MARIVTDPYSEIAGIIETAIRAEFDDLLPYLAVEHDRIHESLGTDGRTYVGISPEDEFPSNIELGIEVLIQFYGPWNADVNPHQTVDPRAITNKAERLRQALQEVRTVGTPGVWFFDIGRTTYPNDPTGNKTRFELTVTGTGNNTGLVETIG